MMLKNVMTLALLGLILPLAHASWLKNPLAGNLPEEWGKGWGNVGDKFLANRENEAKDCYEATEDIDSYSESWLQTFKGWFSWNSGSGSQEGREEPPTSSRAVRDPERDFKSRPTIPVRRHIRKEHFSVARPKKSPTQEPKSGVREKLTGITLVNKKTLPSKQTPPKVSKPEISYPRPLSPARTVSKAVARSTFVPIQPDTPAVTPRSPVAEPAAAAASDLSSESDHENPADFASRSPSPSLPGVPEPETESVTSEPAPVHQLVERKAAPKRKMVFDLSNPDRWPTRTARKPKSGTKTRKTSGKKQRRPGVKGRRRRTPPKGQHHYSRGRRRRRNRRTSSRNSAKSSCSPIPGTDAYANAVDERVRKRNENRHLDATTF